jgi:hypothetical protein
MSFRVFLIRETNFFFELSSSVHSIALTELDFLVNSQSKRSDLDRRLGPPQRVLLNGSNHAKVPKVPQQFWEVP